MGERLGGVLSSRDLPAEEMWAARLDGELFRLAHCFAPVDVAEQPQHRAIAVLDSLPRRLIAEQRSAAWIWGARLSPPPVHELCSSVHSRVGMNALRGAAVREVVIDIDDIRRVGGFQVTSPLRTIIDLARFSTAFEPGSDSSADSDAATVGRLMSLSEIDFEHCRRYLEARRNLPDKRRAMARLTRAWDDSRVIDADLTAQPLLTR